MCCVLFKQRLQFCPAIEVNFGEGVGILNWFPVSMWNDAKKVSVHSLLSLFPPRLGEVHGLVGKALARQTLLQGRRLVTIRGGSDVVTSSYN